MSASLFDSALFGDLVGAGRLAEIMDDRRFVARMIEVEAALARAQAEAGIIPAEAGERLAAALDAIRADTRAPISPADLAEGAAASAVPVPALVAALRARLPQDLSHWLHWGATSQDVMDTAAILRLKDAAALIDADLAEASRALIGLAEAHRKTPQLARTWAQAAAPSSFGLQCAAWLGPLTRLRRRRRELAPRVFAVQLGGAVGTLAAMGPRSLAARARLAALLGLADAPSWHAQRDRMTEIGAWLADVAAAFGRLGLDLVLLSQSDVGEIRLAAAGGSSTMPQKQNPVAPSTLVALARRAAGDQAALVQAALHGQARDGQAWLLEWAAAPPLVFAAGGAASIGRTLLEGVAPDKRRMSANLRSGGGAAFAEAIAFALSEHMPRADAQRLVKDAALSRERGGLVDKVRARTDAPIDFDALAKPAAHFGAADALIDDEIAAARALDAERAP